MAEGDARGNCGGQKTVAAGAVVDALAAVDGVAVVDAVAKVVEKDRGGRDGREGMRWSRRTARVVDAVVEKDAQNIAIDEGDN